MKLTILGSGSTGNGYVLQSEQEALVLEAGMPIQDCLQALEYNPGKVCGCLITHEHGDHSKYIEDYLRYFRCYCSAGTSNAINYRGSFRPETMEALRTYHLGGFSVRPIEAHHDAEEPFCFIIEHDEIGRMLFATDTYFIKYTIPNLTNIMIECNYSLPILNDNVEKGLVPESLKNRTLNSHMSIHNLKNMLAANDLTNVSQIVLIHMSGRNSDRNAFVSEIEKQTGKCTIAARKGLTCEISKTPF